MTAKGYCTKALVASFLGKTFTTAQEAECDRVIERVEGDIDVFTNRGWLMGAQTNEAHYYPDTDLYLRYAPITSVTSIVARTGMGETETTLTVDVDYEVRDANAGLVYLVYANCYDRVRVTYTPVATVPKSIEQAAIEWAATLMQPNLRPDSFALDSFSLPDLSVKFARSHVQEAIPPSVRERLEMWRWVVHK